MTAAPAPIADEVYEDDGFEADEGGEEYVADCSPPGGRVLALAAAELAAASSGYALEDADLARGATVTEPEAVAGNTAAVG